MALQKMLIHRGMLAGHSPLLHTFVFSLSSQSDLLSQWRAYANGGRGVAIGFDVSEMTETVKCWRHWDKLENKIVLAPVEDQEDNEKQGDRRSCAKVDGKTRRCTIGTYAILTLEQPDCRDNDHFWKRVVG